MGEVEEEGERGHGQEHIGLDLDFLFAEKASLI